ncbi:MAG: bifunctional 4-hydroxy-2-oxoglutarate aldolase/2-dehydro-3-deoxy-phosphogluconate aldolase [Prolixibacteraceae bacterium]|nr:bifunctional 4-hydroxy-2-oxoglutarate aldolase/2-dehydro-3-deoxy-phosphogluconate aldolase [Prolixibacteraceae bacterium]
MNEILKTIGDLGLVPVVKIDNAADAVPLGQALIDGGLPIAEITFRTAAAAEAISNIVKAFPNMLVGAGTVLNVEQAEKAISAGAKFLVSPGFNPTVVEYSLKKGVPITPGCSNPTDIEMALGFDLDVVKFFPAEAAGGLNTLKAVSAPYGMMKFIPTGGINAANVVDYLKFNKVLACGGSWMVKDELIKKGDFAEITRLTREAINVVMGFELAHIGINMPDAQSSLAAAKQFVQMFGFALKEGNSSNFAGTGIEINKSIGLGEKGHIAIRTNNINRAVAYLERNGFEADMDTAKGPAGGPVIAVYLKGSVGGFAIHLLQK